MITNFVIIIFIVIFVLLGIRRGMAKTLLNIAGLITSAILAYYLSQFIAELIYNAFFKQNIVNNIETFITQQGIDKTAQNCLDTAPKWIEGLISLVIGLFGMNINQFEKEIKFDSSFSTHAAQSIETAVGGVVKNVLAILLILVVFFILLFIIKLIIKVVSKVFLVPGIKQINKALGSITGAIEGIVFSWIAVNVFFIIADFSNSALLTNKLIVGEVFKFFCVFI